MQESPSSQHVTAGHCVSPQNVDVSRHLTSLSGDTVVQVSETVELNYYLCLGQDIMQSSWFIMVALCNRADHYIFARWFLLSIFFFSSPNLSGRRLDVCHTSTHSVALVRI